MTKIKDKTIVVTGGASGIGRLMVRRCLEKGAAKLIIWDVNEEALESCAHQFTSKGYVVETHLVDVSDVDQVQKVAAQVLHENEVVDILINNAGVVNGKPFHLQSPKEITNILAINVEAVMQVTQAFLPAMMIKKSGHIVNIASAASMLSNPNMSTYVGSKWAVMGWSESLRLELEALKQDLHVTTVTPGYIDTGMFKGVKSPLLLPLLKPKKIVDAIIRGVEENKLIVRKPFMVGVLPFVKGVLPIRVFDWFVGRVLGVYRSMDEFKGH